MSEPDPVAAAERIGQLIDPAEHDVAPLADSSMDHHRLYADPTHDLDDPIACHAVEARSMSAVRAILDGFRRDIAATLLLSQQIGPGAPPVHGATTRALNLLHRAEVEVLRAERGCGQLDGECTDPCHVGVHDDDAVPEPTS